MKRRLASNRLFPAALAIVLSVPAATAAAHGAVTGAGHGLFPTGATYAGVALTDVRFGFGADAGSAGAATGDLSAVLVGSTLGVPRRIVVDGTIGAVASDTSGATTLSGSCTVDLSDGTPPALVPCALAVAPGGAGSGALTLVLGTSSLPAAAVDDGQITVE